MGFIHSKLKNKLAPKTFKKLVFINAIIAAFYDTPVPDRDNIGCTSSDSKDPKMAATPIKKRLKSSLYNYNAIIRLQ